MALEISISEGQSMKVESVASSTTVKEEPQDENVQGEPEEEPIYERCNVKLETPQENVEEESGQNQLEEQIDEEFHVKVIETEEQEENQNNGQPMAEAQVDDQIQIRVDNPTNLNQYSPEIGRSCLKRKFNPSNVSTSLYLRELGFGNIGKEFDFENIVNRHLIKSRAPEGRTPVGAGSVNSRIILQGKRKHNLAHDTNGCQYIRTELQNGTSLRPPSGNRPRASSAPTGIKQYASFMFEKIAIKDQSSNTRRFYTPHPFLTEDPFHWEYSLIDSDPNKYKWRDYDVWFTGSIIETEKTVDGTTKVLKVPNTLFVLENKKMLLYNFNTGQKIDELNLRFGGSGPDRYGSLSVDNQNNKIYISTVKASMPAHLLQEYLVLSYPPLKVLYRIQFLKEAFGKGVVAVENMASILVVYKSSVAEFIDFNELIEANLENELSTPRSSSDEDQNPDLHSALSGMKFIKIVNIPRTLLTIKCQNGSIGLIPEVWPPHIFAKSKSTFDIYNVGNMDKKVFEIPNETVFGDVSVMSFDENVPRLCVSGLQHGFDILEVKHIDSVTKVTTVFTTTNHEQENTSNGISPSTDSTPRRSGLRQVSKKSYSERDTHREFAFAYELNLDLFACCMVSDEKLYITFYFNRTNKVFKRLQPILLKLPKNFKNIRCSGVEAHFEATFLCVKISIIDFKNMRETGSVTEIYTIKFIGDARSHKILNE